MPKIGDAETSHAVELMEAQTPLHARENDALLIEAAIDELLHYEEQLSSRFVDIVNRTGHFQIDEDQTQALTCLLVSTLAMIGSELLRLERILPSLRTLAQLHLSDPFTQQQLELTADAMLGAVQQTLGHVFGEAHTGAWRRLSQIIIGRLMLTQNAA